MILDRLQYDACLKSPRWQDLRRRLLRERGIRCERCRKTWAPGYRHSLQLHHRTYERLGEELDPDVELLCGYCHELADRERESDAKQRSASALYEARLDGWASKRYGEDWTDLERSNVEAAFDDWLDRHDDE